VTANAIDVARLPGMDRLLPALDGLPPAYLVGGAVRDLLLGASSVDLDVALEGDATAAAWELAERLAGRATVHERFGTATVRADDGFAVDLAGTRRERYAAPGALPEVEPAPLVDDLARRDFTINAMAVGLSGGDLGAMHDPHGGEADLRAGLVRVLHGGSFVDDPTRLLRAVRYATRLGFALEPETERLAREAVAEGAPSTVSGPRVRDELLDLLGEAEMSAALSFAREVGLDRALHPALDADADLAASAALGAAETGADRRLAALAALVSRSPDELEPWVDSLALGRSDRGRVMGAARQGPSLVRALRAEPPPSAVHALLRCEPAETLAVALAYRAPAGPIQRFLADLRDVHLEVTGDDLVAAGVPESPAIGRALDEALRLKLDGRLRGGREEELRTALAIARREAG
jgi:tRNA nucleotidyltransferase (CCA-adding enzyme)